MPVYDAESFHPPAPLALVTIRSSAHGLTIVDVPMLIDTGADVSLLPRASVAALMGGDLPQYELAGFDGSVSVAPAVDVELEFLDKSFQGLFLVVEDQCGILGRNVLNNVSLLLNGPALTWDEHR